MERRYNGKETGRRLVSLLLCLVMAAQLLPVTTAAEETARGRAAGSGLHSRTNSENDSSKIPSF